MGYRQELDRARDYIRRAQATLNQSAGSAGTGSTERQVMQRAVNDLRNALSEIDDAEGHMKRIERNG